MEFEEYNKLVVYYKAGVEAIEQVSDEQIKKIQCVKLEAKSVVDGFVNTFTDGLEAITADWSLGKYEKFLDYAEKDGKLSEEAVAVISAAYVQNKKLGEDIASDASALKKIVAALDDDKWDAVLEEYQTLLDAQMRGGKESEEA